MPIIIPGYDTQQKTLTVPNTDEDMNEAINEQASEGWIVGALTPSGDDMVILFTRNVAIEV